MSLHRLAENTRAERQKLVRQRDDARERARRYRAGLEQVRSILLDDERPDDEARLAALAQIEELAA